MLFKPMDPALAEKLIEGYPNELAGESRALEIFYRSWRCPRCQGEGTKETVRGHTFGDSSVLVPRSCLRCNSCKCLFDPHSNLLLERGATKFSL